MNETKRLNPDDQKYADCTFPNASSYMPGLLRIMTILVKYIFRSTYFRTNGSFICETQEATEMSKSNCKEKLSSTVFHFPNEDTIDIHTEFIQSQDSKIAKLRSIQHSSDFCI